MKTDEVNEIILRLHEARKRAKELCGDQYAAKMAEYRKNIEAVMAAQGIDAIEAGMGIVAGLQEQYPMASGTQQTLTLAAVVEMMEPELTDGDLCEGCREPAVTHDSEGVPLCAICAAIPNDPKDQS